MKTFGWSRRLSKNRAASPQAYFGLENSRKYSWPGSLLC
jgi:hypothetical protein